MQPNLKKILRALSLEIRHTLEGSYDAAGIFHPGDLETRLNELGVWRERAARPLAELPHLSAEDKAARQVIDAYIAYRAEAGVERAGAVAEFVREAAYNWANRLLALRCMEARGIIDEVVLQKAVYGGRSMVHNRLAKKDPQSCAGLDEGLFAVLLMEFQARAEELPELFAPNSPAIALQPSLPALKRVIGLLSGTLRANGQEAATDEVFSAPDALGWAYQYWNSEEKDRVFEMVRTQKSAKIEGADIIPATQLYTEPYMVKFLVQNSLGALWVGMHPESTLAEGWEYYIKDSDRAPVECKPVQTVTLLDPACGSGHFLLEAFNLLFEMYQEEDHSQTLEEIAATILNNNLYGIDIDERAVQIAAAALWMKAKEYAPALRPAVLSSFHHHLAATNIRLPKGKDHLKEFLAKHPESVPLQTALEAIFEGLENVHELGSLVQIEEPVEKELRYLQGKYESAQKKGIQPDFFAPVVVQGELPIGVESYEQWKSKTLKSLNDHFELEAESVDPIQSFFGQTAFKGLILLDLLSHRYDVIAANPPYMGSKNLSEILNKYLNLRYSIAKHDLYSAFILKALTLKKSSGYVALVTMQSFLYTNRFVELREFLFKRFHLSLALHLGANAFPEMKDHVVAICTIWQEKSQSKCAYVIDVRNNVDKPSALQNPIFHNVKNLIGFELEKIHKLPGMPFLYDLPESFYSVFEEKDNFSSYPDIFIREGVHSKPDERFQRYFWEIGNPNNRWYTLTVGGARQKWAGLDDNLVDFENNGLRIKQMPSPIVPSEELYFKPGLSYSDAGGSGFSCRVMENDSVFSSTGPAIIPQSKNITPLLGYLNSTTIGFLLDMLNPGNHYKINDLKRLPLDSNILNSKEISEIASTAANQKVYLIRSLITSREFLFQSSGSKTIRDYVIDAYKEKLFAEVDIVKCEYRIDRIVNKLLNLDGQAENFINERYRPLLDMETTPNTNQFIGNVENVSKQFSPGNIEFGDRGDKVFVEYEVEAIAINYSISIEAAQNALLKLINEETGIRKYGPNILSQKIPSVILALLGHRWPKQIETGAPVPTWVDPDGIIPLTPGLKDLPLLERVRSRLPEQFPGGNVTALEHEFAEIMGESLEKWLSSSFFKHHISQFKKRPIAWQLTSQLANGKGGKGKGKKGLGKNPAFSCLVYYHKLNASTLTTIKSQYVSPLRQSYETELRTLEAIVLLSPEQSSRRLQLEAWIDELKEFEDRLERCAREGFASPALAQVAAKEPLDRWASREGQVQPPANRAEFEAQEMRYDPDLNDGVRVNIAPLQKFGLLAADVLDAKDIEKAIADRAEWRVDERRWCRDGKLPKPGWWK